MPYLRHIAMALLMLGCSVARTSHPSESALDQYAAREDPLHPPQSLSRAGAPRSRRRRSYQPWTRQFMEPSDYQSITVWQPSSFYAISRPYYIPIFGAPGRVPIYFPPQALPVNPGAPQDNRPFEGPPYLPPETTTKVNIEDRFNGDQETTTRKMFDGMPVWDSPGAATTPRSPVKPTRLPPSAGEATHPPLKHVPESSGAAASQQAAPPVSSGPTPCVWAIISCCSGGSTVNTECFAARGCPGVFWGRSPCDSDYAKAAIASALNYYNTNGK